MAVDHQGDPPASWRRRVHHPPVIVLLWTGERCAQQV